MIPLPVLSLLPALLPVSENEDQLKTIHEFILEFKLFDLRFRIVIVTETSGWFSHVWLPSGNATTSMFMII